MSEFKPITNCNRCGVELPNQQFGSRCEDCWADAAAGVEHYQHSLNERDLARLTEINAAERERKRGGCHVRQAMV